jgi:hypothetical protein
MTPSDICVSEAPVAATADATQKIQLYFEPVIDSV